MQTNNLINHIYYLPNQQIFMSLNFHMENCQIQLDYIRKTVKMLVCSMAGIAQVVKTSNAFIPNQNHSKSKLESQLTSNQIQTIIPHELRTLNSCENS